MKRRHISTITDTELLDMRAIGMSLRDIERETGIGRRAVEGRLARIAMRGLRVEKPPVKWRPQDVQAMMDMATGGASNATIARRIGRTPQAVSAKMIHVISVEKRIARSRTPAGKPEPVQLGALVPVEADWGVILYFRQKYVSEAKTVSQINAYRVMQGISPFEPVEPFKVWKRRVAA